MDETIHSESAIGQRLEKIKQGEKCCLLFNGKKIPVVTKITIGREKDNDLVIDSKLVSRYHAFVQKIKDDYFIRDLHSANGTFVNDAKVPVDKYIKVNSRDVIRIANVEVNLL